MTSEGLLNKQSTLFRSQLFLFVVLISFFHYLDEEFRLALFADKLFIVTGVQFPRAHGAERDFSGHVVLDTRIVFLSQRGF